MKFEIGQELVALKDIHETSGDFGKVLAEKGDGLVVESIFDGVEEEDFMITVSPKNRDSGVLFVVRNDEVGVTDKSEITDHQAD